MVEFDQTFVKTDKYCEKFWTYSSLDRKNLNVTILRNRWNISSLMRKWTFNRFRETVERKHSSRPF